MLKKNLYFFFIFGGSWGALTSNPGERKFQGSKTSSQSRHMYNKGKKLPRVFHISATIYKNVYFWLFGGPWVAHK